MPRPKRCRRVCKEPEISCFIPEGVDEYTKVVLSVDEYEVIRLVDHEKLSHEQCAAIMDISRTTVTEIYEEARYKIADCLVHGKKLIISGGNYRIYQAEQNPCCNRHCRRLQKGDNQVKYAKGEMQMKQ